MIENVEWYPVIPLVSTATLGEARMTVEAIRSKKDGRVLMWAWVCERLLPDGEDDGLLPYPHNMADGVELTEVDARVAAGRAASRMMSRIEERRMRQQ